MNQNHVRGLRNAAIQMLDQTAGRDSELLKSEEHLGCPLPTLLAILDHYLELTTGSTLPDNTEDSEDV